MPETCADDQFQPNQTFLSDRLLVRIYHLHVSKEHARLRLKGHSKKC
jgi:hypothetical protein